MPVPVPLVVILSVFVGFRDKPQHTPLVVIAVPPSLVTIPPLNAVVSLMFVTTAVETIGSSGQVVISWCQSVPL